MSENRPDFVLNLTQSREPLYCQQIVREIAGKRRVCLASWNNQQVYAKLYFGGRSAHRHWLRELAGLQALHRHQILSPAIIHTDKTTNNKAFVVLLKPVQAAISAQQVWDQADNDQQRLALLQDLITVIARQHAAGLRQHDLHLNNFLSAKQQLFTLDGGDIILSQSPLNQQASLENLALLFAQLAPDNDHLIEILLPFYCTQRQWLADASLLQVFYTSFSRQRRKRRDKYLQKIFRECSAFACQKRFNRYTVYNRRYASDSLIKLLADPDSSFPHCQTQVLKNGDTCTVWSTQIADHQLVIKRYNIKGFWHGLNRSWRRTRAAISWKNAHRLQFYNIETATPVALIEERFGPVRRRAYFITVAIEGKNCIDFFRSRTIPDSMTNKAVAALVILLQRLARLKISHGDMKGKNIILADSGPAVIDLDSMREHRTSLFFDRRQRRDIRRFLHNWRDQPRLLQLFKATLDNSTKS